MKLFVWLLKEFESDDYECPNPGVDAGLVVALARNQAEAEAALPDRFFTKLGKPEKVIDCTRRHKRPFVAYATFAPLIEINQDITE